MKSLTAITALFLVAGCGDDSTDTDEMTGSNNVRLDENNRSVNNTSSNNTSSNNTSNTSNNTSSNNASSNNSATNNTSNNSTNNTSGTNNTTNNSNGITEAEPNDERSTANTISFGDTVSGVLESGGVDTFALTTTAGKILEVEILAADPSLNISMFVEGATSDIGDRRFDFDNIAGSKRQYFLPEDDTWYVTLQSLEAIDWDYRFVVREVTPTPITNAFSATVAGDLNDGAVDVYALPAAAGRIQAALDAERLAQGSDLDSVMYVYSPTAGFVTFNDDASATTDSELDFTAMAGTTYWLVVDAWRLGADNPYELAVQIP
ncbi:MAG: hypothetical protein R3E66_06600 [bacterium]